MYKRIIVLMILLPYFCFGQIPHKLRGTYSGFTEYYSEKIKFKKNNEFEFDSNGCLGSRTGKGRYVLVEDSLILNFYDIDSNRIDYLEIDSLESKEDSATINIQVIDMGKPLNSIALEILEHPDSFNTILDFTERNGKARLKFLNPEHDVYLRIHLWLRFDKYNDPILIKLKPNRNYNIVSYTYSQDEEIHPWLMGRTIKQKITSIKRNKFMLNTMVMKKVTFMDRLRKKIKLFFYNRKLRKMKQIDE